MKRPLLLIVFLFAACTTTAPAPAPKEPVHVVIVGTTDVHGWFAGHDETAADKKTKLHNGGLAIFAGYVGALRDANPGRVVLVDSGDLFQGTLESNIFEGEPVVLGYNAVGYTAAAVGNHEFDYGPAGPKGVPREPGDDPLGALKRNASLAHFPFLSANMYEKGTHTTPPWAKPYTLVNVGGAKLGIIGLSTPDTPNVTMSQNVTTLDFVDPVPVTIEAAKKLRAEGADAVIVIAHMGGRCRVIDQDPHDASSCETMQEAMHLLGNLPKGTIDGYFAGHTHATMRHYVNGVPAMQALAYSIAFSTLDLWIDPQTHHVIEDKTQLRPMTQICTEVWSGTVSCDPKEGKNGATLVPRQFEGRTIAADAQLTRLFAPYLAKVEAKRNEPTGIRTTGLFRRSYQHEAELGDVLADAMRMAMKADVAFINSGGIRADLRPGDLTYSDIFEVSPFDNYPATITLTGAQVERALQLTTTGERGVLQVSGLRYKVDWAKDADKRPSERQRVVSVTMADGSPLVADKLYKVALPDFLATGGDGLMPVVKEVPPERLQISLDQPLRELFIPALRALPQPLSPKTDGRITVVNDKGDDR